MVSQKHFPSIRNPPFHRTTIIRKRLISRIVFRVSRVESWGRNRWKPYSLFPAEVTWMESLKSEELIAGMIRMLSADLDFCWIAINALQTRRKVAGRYDTRNPKVNTFVYIRACAGVQKWTRNLVSLGSYVWIFHDADHGRVIYLCLWHRNDVITK
jgi:hypothetical protein